MWLLLAAIDGPIPVWPRAESSADDQAAVARLARGDSAGIADLYDRHARPVYSLAFRILGSQSDAEDVVQEVFSQVWQQAARYDPSRGRVAAWLLNLTRSRAIDRLRASRVRRTEAMDDARGNVESVADRSLLPDVQAVFNERGARVRLAVAQLPVLQRSALEMAYYEGLTHVEISARLGEPLGTVKTRIRTGLLRLRELLGAEPL